MGAKNGKYNGRNSDLTFSWLTNERGKEWAKWQDLIAGWIKTQQQGLNLKLSSMIFFVLHYLPTIPNGHEPSNLFKADQLGLLPDFENLNSDAGHSLAIRRKTHIFQFINWVIVEKFSVPNDEGLMISTASNPFGIAKRGNAPYTESVHSPLPYTYIKELRDILCSNAFGNFSDWTWAHQATGQNRSNGNSAGKTGDWFQVAPSVIDPKDPDCVWRVRSITSKSNKVVERYEIWSPVRATVLFVKLHLPLRTYQIRFLDSGEADTWRYEKGNWTLNQSHPFKNGSEKNPWRKGVFRRIHDHQTGGVMTGLYINTNKTADQNRDERERGYCIPWQHAEVLHWLEKLRNWQEKYNPINQPTPCIDLETKHFHNVKSEQQRRDMGAFCFLFRDASAKGLDRCKPITKNNIDMLWYRLLCTLEDQVASRGQTLANGSRLRFVKEYKTGHSSPKFATEFPLHSLRVSLLTCFAMEGQVPMPALAKLLAGHSRLLMTLYYVKPTPAIMTQALDAATVRVEAAQTESLRTFLRDQDMRQIKEKVAYREEASLNAALANRNPAGWEHRHVGLCLVGGNNTTSEESGVVGGCWNGGDFLFSRGKAGGVYGPVPNGPENCTRCRWLVTDARYLDALRAQFNNQSYKASLAANLAIEHEHVRDALLDVRYAAAKEGRPFVQQHELQEAERRYEKQIVLADQYAKDMIATFQLIARVVAIEEARAEGDHTIKLVSVGTMQDIHRPISLIETSSEMLQLTQICEDAELYPDLADEIYKTPAIEKRSRALNRLLMRNGYTPIFMHMDERMQLIAGNAMMRAMACKASPNDQLEGFIYITGALEVGQYLKLLPEGIKALESIYQSPVIKLSDLIATAGKSISGGE